MIFLWIGIICIVTIQNANVIHSIKEQITLSLIVSVLTLIHLIPEGYWDNPDHSSRPVSVFMTPDGFSGFGNKVSLKTEYVEDKKDTFKSYEKVNQVRDYESAIQELEELRNQSSFSM